MPAISLAIIAGLWGGNGREPSAAAALFWWDGATSLADGQSNNSTTTTLDWLNTASNGGFWDNGTADAKLTSWTAGDSAIFGGSAASETINAGNFTIGNLTFGAGPQGAGASGTSYTLGGASATLTLSASTITANTNTSISAILAGASALTTTGSGTLTLSGNNSFTGALTVQSGILSVAVFNDPGSTGPLGNNGSNTVRTTLGANGQTGELQYTGGVVSINRAFNIGGTGGIIEITNPNATVTANAVAGNAFNGNAPLTKLGPGALSLPNGSTNFTGQFILSGGTLIASNKNSLGGGSASLVLNAGTTLDITAGAGFSLGRNTTVNGSMTIVVDRSGSGTGLSYSLGTLGINASTLTVGGGNTTSGTAAITFANTTLSGASNFNIVNPALGGTTSLTIGALTNGGFTPTLSGNGNFAQTAAATGLGGFTLGSSYSGIATFNQANGYSGATTINGGTLVISNSTGSATGSNDITLAAGTLSSGAVGSVTGNVLAGAADHFIIPGGLGAAGVLTLGGITTNAHTTLNFDVGTTSSGTGANGLTIYGGGDLIALGAGALTAGSGTKLVFSSNPSGLGDYRLFSGSNLAGVATGNFTLPAPPNNTLSYSLSTTVDSGFLDLVVNSGVSLGSGTWTNGAGDFKWTNAGNWQAGQPIGAGLVATFDNTGLASTPSPVQLTGGITVGGVMLNTASSGYTIGLGGADGTLTLDNSPNSAAATIAATSGSHTIAAPLAVGSLGVNISGSGSLRLAGAANAFSGPIKVTGAGTTTLAGGNTFNPSASITVGTGTDSPTLLIQPSSGSTVVSAATVATINAGATLQLAGTASALTDATTPARRMQVTNNGTLRAGGVINSVNVLTTQKVGAITGSGTTIVADSPSGGANVLTADRIVQNSLVIGFHSTFQLAASDAHGNPTIDLNGSLLSGGGSAAVAGLPISSSSLTNSLIGMTASTAPDRFSGSTVAAVPEPAGWVIGMFCCVGLWFASRKAKTQLDCVKIRLKKQCPKTDTFCHESGF